MCRAVSSVQVHSQQYVFLTKANMVYKALKGALSKKHESVIKGALLLYVSEPRSIISLSLIN